MKKQSNNQATNLATKNDLKKVEKSLRTELLRLEGRLEKKFVTKLDLGDAMEGLEERVDERARRYRDELLTKLDGVMGELQNMREDNIIGTHQTSELSGRVDGHEVRITVLEK